MKNAHIIKTLQWIAIAFFIGFLFMVCVATYSFAQAISQPKGRVSCASFGSYEDALRAYGAGATWLDRDGDGIPCEALYKQDHGDPYGE